MFTGFASFSLVLIPLRTAVTAGRREPLLPPTFIDAVGGATGRDANVLMREQELSDSRIQREAVHAITGCIDQERAGSVQRVAGRDLLSPCHMQSADEISAFSGRAPMDRKDRPHRDVHVKVRRAVRWINKDDIL